MKRTLLLSLACLVVFSIGGCDSSGDNSNDCVLDNDPPSVDLSANVETFNVGDQINITISGSDPNGDNIDLDWDLEKPDGSDASLSSIRRLDASNDYEGVVSFVADVAGQYTIGVRGADFEDTGGCNSADSDEVTISAIE